MSPLSLDLRHRIIRAWQEEKVTILELAERFSVGSATVKRLVWRFRKTGSVEPLPHGGGQKHWIPVEKLVRVRKLVEANPDWSVDELAAAYNRQEGTNPSRSTMDRALRRLGFTRKQKSWSPRNATPNALRPGAKASSRQSEPSPLRVWYLWTKPARTRR
jgi:transposase